MPRATASIEVPGLASEAEALWYDPVRWAAWVDGFGHVVELSEEWPAAGTLQWKSTPEGRGRVRETVTGYEPRSGQTLAVEDGRLRGTQQVRFTPGPEAVKVTLALEYELKQSYVASWLFDRVFVRRGVVASLRRTLAHFARERRGDIELELGASR